MTSFIDPEFGEIIVHKRRGSRGVRIRIGTNGRYTVTAPVYTPLIYIKQVVNTSREDLRSLANHPLANEPYADGQKIGKHHQLRAITTGMVSQPKTKIERQTLIVYLPPDTSIDALSIQQLIRDAVVTILRREAKPYLTEHLARLARDHGFHYERIRFSHASGRWGSCSSTGTISLNIALMKLPDELIEYVLIHELSHTKHMNHSPAFWAEVERYDPHYRLHRRQIKTYTPSV